MKSDVEKLRVLNKLVEHYGYQNWWENENRIEDWVAMILIQRTTERNCHLALDNLEGYFTAEQLLEMELEKLRELIRPAGFNKQKSVYIKELMDWYKGHGYSLDKFKDIPTEDIRTELLSIKGVGPETADAMLQTMLVLFGITSKMLLLSVTIGVVIGFALLYWIIYRITSKVYLNIVE